MWPVCVCFFCFSLPSLSPFVVLSRFFVSVFVAGCKKAGQDEFSTMSTNTAIGVHGYLLVFSVRDRGSFDLVEEIRSRLMVTLGGQMVPTVLVGNKSDCATSEREISVEEGKKMAKEMKLSYAECSALTGAGVRGLFINLLRDVNQNIAGEIVAEEQKCSIS